jgi:folate-binding Fe-S cluster repair protein YgfZ
MRSRINQAIHTLLVLIHVVQALSFQHGRVWNRRLNPSTSLKEKAIDELPSSYDRYLPATLRAEAVRASIRSDRGACLDFTSKSPGRNVGVVKVTGKGVLSFLNNKLSNTFNDIDLSKDEKEVRGKKITKFIGVIKSAGLLTSKGRIVDKLLVPLYKSSSAGIEAYMVTSPGHEGSQLFDRLDPFIFPLDGVKLEDLCPDQSGNTRVFTFIASSSKVAENCFLQNVSPIISPLGLDSISFPTQPNECIKYVVTDDSKTFSLQILPTTFLPENVVSGYTVLLTEDKPTGMSLAEKIWQRCISESNINGPVELGALEFENLRIEAGMPGYGFEMTGAMETKRDTSDESRVKLTKVSPLELYLDDIVDTNKGCYQGQEGVAALLKNKGGLPRTLYTVIFPDEDNYYDGQKDEEEYSNHSDRIENKTKLPKVGDDLFVLGSNEKIKVGTITSVSEHGGTSMREIVGLALIKRAGSILKQMNDMNIEITRDSMFDDDSQWTHGGGELQSGIILPPPLDDLDGLEVVIGNSFTQGYIRPIPSKRLRKDERLFEVEHWSIFQNDGENGSTMGFIDSSAGNVYDNDIDNVSMLQSNDEFSIEESNENIDDDDLDAAIESARLAAEEAQRKAEKLEMLKRQAEEAKQRRKEAKKAEDDEKVRTESKSSSLDKGMEAQRKAEKMELLKRRAEEALARRRNKKTA